MLCGCGQAVRPDLRAGKMRGPSDPADTYAALVEI